MLALLISWLCWIPADGVCDDARVKISPVINQVVPVGAHFRLRCEFTCLSSQHVAQMWKSSPSEDRHDVSLVNITSAQPNMTMELNIDFATSNHSGDYSCKTHPPDTISPSVSITVSGTLTQNLTQVSTQTPTSPISSQQLNATSGLMGQMWYWMILGKTLISLIMFTFLAIKYRT